MAKLLNKQKLSVVADLGLTCGGDIGLACELIEISSNLGVDAVKFQMLDAGELLADRTVEYTYPTLLQGPKTENMYKMFLSLEMNDHEWSLIKSKCDSLGLELIITCHVESAVPRVNALCLPYNKICTWSINHFHMISKLAKNGKPLIIDTGTVSINEIFELQEFYRSEGGGDLIVFFDFHTDDEGFMNFQAIEQLIEHQFVTGYTPQGRQDWLDYMSIGLGVSTLEKRLAMSRYRPKNGYWKAHDPKEFKDWMENVKRCHLSLGEKFLQPTPDDLKVSTWAYKSAFLREDVAAGQLIDKNCFDFKRPGNGISSKTIWQKYLGTRFPRNFKKGELFISEKD